MKRGKPINVGASIRQRLMNLAKDRGEEFQYILTRYGLERLLDRLSRSPHSGNFVLKGAALFQLWTNQPHRPTRDLDFLGHGERLPDRIESLFREVCRTTVDDDGLDFDPDTITTEQIKEDSEYHGIRLKLVARLQSARIPLQIDVGFGDAITPGALKVFYPTLLGQSPPVIWAYPRETVVAEKFQAMVMLGMANSRMKDFYDVWMIARQFAFDGRTLSHAIHATFERRQTELPSTEPIAFTSEFTNDERKQTQWTAFLKKGRLADPKLELNEVTKLLSNFLMSPTRAAITGESFELNWSSDFQWR